MPLARFRGTELVVTDRQSIRAKGLTNVISQGPFKVWEVGKHYGVLKFDGTVTGVQFILAL